MAVSVQQMKKRNVELPSNKEIVARLYFPKNENLAPILENNLGVLWPVAEDMLYRKDYRESFPFRNGQPGYLELWATRGEDSTSKILSRPNPRQVAITGSDFVLEQLLEYPKKFSKFSRGIRQTGPSMDIWKTFEKEVYTNPSELIGKDLKPDYMFRFEGGDRIAEMRILEYPKGIKTPFLCILGPNDTTFDELIKRRNDKGKKVKAVSEERFKILARRILDYEGIKRGFDYTLETVPSASEGDVRSSIYEDRSDLADIAVEIGQTFSTARANGLEKYAEIMPTYPVELVYFRSNDQKVMSLSYIKENFSEAA